MDRLLRIVSLFTLILLPAAELAAQPELVQGTPVVESTGPVSYGLKVTGAFSCTPANRLYKPAIADPLATPATTTVFTSNDYANDRDGKGDNGNTLPENTYYYVLKTDKIDAIKGFIVIQY